MISPTLAEIAAAKGAAQKRNGRDEVLEVKHGAPIGFVGLFAPLVLSSYAKAIDAITADALTGHSNLALDQLLWPDQATYMDAVRRMPAIPTKTSSKIMARAGRNVPDPVVERLADILARKATADGVGDPLPGLSAVRAAELTEQAEGDLWAAVSPLLCCVLASPDPDLWLAAQTAELRAVKSHEGLVTTRLDFARQAVVWSSRPLDELFADVPAVATDLWTAYKLIGGEGAETSCKSL